MFLHRRHMSTFVRTTIRTFSLEIKNVIGVRRNGAISHVSNYFPLLKWRLLMHGQKSVAGFLDHNLV